MENIYHHRVNWSAHFLLFTDRLIVNFLGVLEMSSPIPTAIRVEQESRSCIAFGEMMLR